MSRSIVTALTLGLLVGAACKKSETTANQVPVQKGQDVKGTGTDKGATDKAGATGAMANADAAASTGVQAGGIERSSEGAAGVLATMNGTVEVRRLGETTWTAAKADTQLYAGDSVRTAEASTATVLLADESTIEIAEASTVAVASRAGTADPASSAAVMNGLARFTVTPRTPGEGAFRVYTASSVILTKGTTYGVGVAASGEARVGVESGAVEVIGIAQLDAEPVTVDKSTQVTVAAEGKVGSTSAWATDDWGTWRDEADAKIQLTAAVEAHGKAMEDMHAALVSGYAELDAQADMAASMEAKAATSAEANDTATYTTTQPEFAATIDASFALAGRLEALTWANAAHATLATDLYVRHPADVQAQWTMVAPRVDAAVLWPKRFEVTATAFWEPLRSQYYVHHPRGRAHASLVGIAVPQFYAQVQPQPVDPAMVRTKIKGQIWFAPQLAYKPSPRSVWVSSPNANWHAKVKVAPAPARAKVAWYVRPATLKSTAFLGAKVTGNWESKLAMQPPQPRAALAASWKIPVGTKIKIDAPDLNAAASARSKVKLGADGRMVYDAKMMGAGNAAAGMKAGANIKAPEVTMPDAKAKLDVTVKGGANMGAHGAAKAGMAAGGAANAATDVKTKVDGAVKASANAGAAAGAGASAGAKAAGDVKVQAPKVEVKAPKVEVKGSAKGSFKLGN